MAMTCQGRQAGRLLSRLAAFASEPLHQSAKAPVSRVATDACSFHFSSLAPHELPGGSFLSGGGAWHKFLGHTIRRVVTNVGLGTGPCVARSVMAGTPPNVLSSIKGTAGRSVQQQIATKQSATTSLREGGISILRAYSVGRQALSTPGGSRTTFQWAMNGQVGRNTCGHQPRGLRTFSSPSPTPSSPKPLLSCMPGTSGSSTASTTSASSSALRAPSSRALHASSISPRPALFTGSSTGSATASSGSSGGSQVSMWTRVKHALQLRRVTQVVETGKEKGTAVFDRVTGTGARYRQAIGLQVEAFWRRHSTVLLASGAVVVALVLWRVMFGVASLFIDLSERMANFGVLALAASMVLCAGVYLSHRASISPDAVYRLAMRHVNTFPAVLEVMGAPLTGSDVRAYIMTGGGVRVRGLVPRLSPRRVHLIFPVTGSERKGLVSVEAKKRKGRYEMKLLAVDVPTARGEEQRLYILGGDHEYQKGGGLIAELRDPIVKALSSQKEFEEEDDNEDEEEVKRAKEREAQELEQLVKRQVEEAAAAAQARADRS